MDIVSQALAGASGRLVAPMRSGKAPASELLAIEIPGRLPTSPGKTVAVRVAETDACRRSAAMLINRMYAWRGYATGCPMAARPSETMFTASIDADIVGTLTLAADSDEGLAVEKTFPQEVRHFRNDPGSSLCELKRFAVDADMSSKNLLAALFHTVLIYGSDRYASTDLFIEVNPRHIRFYEAMLGFQRIGGLRTNLSVDAPSQLMWLRVANIRRMVEQYKGNRTGTCRSLYPYFLSPQDEQQICARIAAARSGSPSDYSAARSLQVSLPDHLRSLAA